MDIPPMAPMVSGGPVNRRDRPVAKAAVSYTLTAANVEERPAPIAIGASLGVLWGMLAREERLGVPPILVSTAN